MIDEDIKIKVFKIRVGLFKIDKIRHIKVAEKVLDLKKYLTMKINYIVSTIEKAWIKNSQKIFLHDAYIYHYLKKNNKIKNYNFILLPKRKLNQLNFENHLKFIEKKRKKYIKLILKRILQIHNNKYTKKFFSQIILLPLNRYIALVLNFYSQIKKDINIKKHDFKILSPKCYYTPENLDELKKIIIHSEIGSEQLFSIYVSMFCKNNYPSFTTNPENLENDDYSIKHKSIPNLNPIIILKKIIYKLCYINNPKVGILNSYFSANKIYNLVIQSLGKIQVLHLPYFKSSKSKLNLKMREEISSFEKDFDEFDKFFFKSLFYFFPKSLLEDFDKKFIFYNSYFNNLPKLKYLISEAWISDENTSFAIAILKDNDVKLIYNEHNYLGHPFLGNNLKYISKLVFKYFTLGWKDKNNKKIVSSGSLFESLSPINVSNKEKFIDILFVSSVPTVKIQDFNGSYGESGSENVLNYFKFLNSFFKSLKSNILKKYILELIPLDLLEIGLFGIKNMNFEIL